MNFVLGLCVLLIFFFGGFRAGIKQFLSLGSFSLKKGQILSLFILSVHNLTLLVKASQSQNHPHVKEESQGQHSEHHQGDFQPSLPSKLE